ncbi:PREDICTED: uncharacterized protein LOC108778293 [Cyphomyrmex costatus]|uniref:uncharacterized protein LOC108778293 n=1 Tax=Cyphomyrmex costatus TaxID=456900 RepID=UPI0008521E4C|nr:PREDICTED: uncharacterized protein LOC108778293 [Cyphomyrmex costatus]
MEKSEIFPEKPGKRSYIEFVCSSSEDKEEDITPPKKIPRRVPVKKLTENIEKLTEEAQKRRRKGNKKFLRMLFNSLDKMLSILEKKVTEGAEERGHKEYMDLKRLRLLEVLY